MDSLRGRSANMRHNKQKRPNPISETTKRRWRYGKQSANGIKDTIRQLANVNKATDEHERALRDLEHDKPQAPKVPRLVYGDATPAALQTSLATVWPAGGILSAEARIVFGAHGMNKENIMQNLALFNVLWDGGSIPTDRRTTESL